MVIKVYGPNYSPCVGRVLAALREKNVPFEQIPVDLLKGEHKHASFMALQPFGQVPVLDDDGLILFESRAICRYIATKYRDQGADLLADKSDAETRAMMEVWSSVETTDFDARASKLAAKVHRASLDKILDIYETRLSGREYLAGDV
ncbi:hypothetical protein HK101_003410 [Irineochytrium annulatum]|nr:hypothetical protein HK101_003410 [Irineochytrium annulatum]